MAGIMQMGGAMDFLGGALGQLGKEQDRTDAIDDYRKKKLIDLDAAKQLDTAREASQEQRLINVDKAKKGTGQLGSELTQMLSGVQPPNPAGNAGAQPIPGVPSQLAPIQQQQPIPGAMQPQTAGSPDTIQPRTAPVAMPQQQTADAQGLQPDEIQAQELPAGPGEQGGAVPLIPPADKIAVNSPAGQLRQGASAAMPQDQESVQSVIDSAPSDHTRLEANRIAKVWGITDPDEFKGILATRAMYGDGPEATDKFNKWMDSHSKEVSILSKNAPTGVDTLGSDDQEHMKAMYSLGIHKEGQPLKPISPGETQKVDKLFTDSMDARQGAQQGMNSILSMAHATSDMNTGPLAEADAKLHAYLSSLTGSQLDSVYSDWWEANKNTIAITNAQMRAIKATRPGIQLAKLEKEGVPGAEMPPEARVNMLIQFYNSYRGAYNHADALMSGPSDLLHVGDRVKFANKYDDENPAQLSDGSSNPNFMEFDDWRKTKASGGTSKGVTGSNLRQQGNTELLSSKKDVEEGGTGKIAPPTISNAEDYGKLTEGQQYTDPDGNIRTKGTKKK